jgi:hypothetical protein
MKIGRADYQERREAKIERLRERAADKAIEAQKESERAHKILSFIPMGQPILIGHHSEGRHRRDIGRIDSAFSRAYAAGEESKHLEARANAAESNRAISSDNPDAIDLLRVKLAKIEKSRTFAISANKAIRSAKGDAAKACAALQALGFTEGQAADLLAPDFAGRIGIPSYKLTNWSSEARRIKQRIEALEATSAREPMPEEKIVAVTIREQDNRVQLLFPGKPSDEIRARLRSNGFRWSPTSGAWQRMPSAWAWHVAREIAKAVTP